MSLGVYNPWFREKRFWLESFVDEIFGLKILKDSQRKRIGFLDEGHPWLCTCLRAGALAGGHLHYMVGGHLCLQYFSSFFFFFRTIMDVRFQGNPYVGDNFEGIESLKEPQKTIRRKKRRENGVPGRGTPLVAKVVPRLEDISAHQGYTLTIGHPQYGRGTPLLAKFVAFSFLFCLSSPTCLIAQYVWYIFLTPSMFEIP